MVMGCVSLVRRLGSATAPKRTADGERAGELPSKRAGGDDGQSGEPLLLAERRPLLGRSGGGGLHMPSFCEKGARDEEVVCRRDTPTTVYAGRSGV